MTASTSRSMLVYLDSVSANDLLANAMVHHLVKIATQMPLFDASTSNVIDFEVSKYFRVVSFAVSCLILLNVSW